MAWFVLLTLLIVAGGFAYHWLVELEKEIRAEIDTVVPASVAGDETKKEEPGGGVPVADQILDKIRSSPGLRQTELYNQLPGIDRKVLQKELLILDRSGKLLRKKSGNTYQLFLK